MSAKKRDNETSRSYWKRKHAGFAAKHPEIDAKYRKKAAHARHIKEEHGMDRADYEYLLRLQRGRCAICRRTPREVKMVHLAVDHCHATNRTRGLLCSGCNLTLGVIREDPKRVNSLKVDPAKAQGFLDYIERRCHAALQAGPI